MSETKRLKAPEEENRAWRSRSPGSCRATGLLNVGRSSVR